MPILVFILRLAIGGLLIVTGALKVAHPELFAAAVAGYRLLPQAAILPVAIALPYFEIVFGIYLVLGLFTRIAGTVAALTFALYAAAIASAVVRHIPANCGCFGPHDTATADWPHVGFDIVLAATSAIIAKAAPGTFSVDRRLRQGV
jgi:uncharacterized membrane protein YphA (DoxX/SURF4 family)